MIHIHPRYPPQHAHEWWHNHFRYVTLRDPDPKSMVPVATKRSVILTDGFFYILKKFVTMAANREDSPLIIKKNKRKKKGKKRKFTEIDGHSNENKSKRRKAKKQSELNSSDNSAYSSPKKRIKLSQSVCCPICIVNISIFSDIEADTHIANCLAKYQAMKQNQTENISNSANVSMHQQRRQNQIKQKQTVDKWNKIFDPKPNINIKRKKDTTAHNSNAFVIPAFKQLKGTNIIINKFNYHTVNPTKYHHSVHFLTHFRFDYYIGITSQWSKPIYCSQITAKLLKHKFTLKEDVIHALPMYKQTLISHSNPVVFVTLLPSNNYINGSVNLLFQITGNRSVRYQNNHNTKRETVINING
eukprot:600794_1